MTLWTQSASFKLQLPLQRFSSFSASAQPHSFQMKMLWVVVSWLMAVSVLSAEALRSRDTHITESVSVADGLSATHYSSTCPKLESIVKKKTKSFLDADITQAAGLLRLQFHDCFVQGCDASILLNGSRNRPSERTATPNLTIRQTALAFINELKQIVEEECPLTVSCADIVTLASGEAIWGAGGPFIPFPLGRRDSSRHATVFQTLNNIPNPNMTTTELLTAFAAKNLDKHDLVALSGGHTIGIGHCSSFTSRLYPQQDPTLDNSFAKLLKSICPTSNSSNTADIDNKTPNLFDNKYYKNLEEMQGLFISDQTLYTDSRTKDLVLHYAKSEHDFLEQFTKSMIKMSQLDVLTGINGEIRQQCNFPNPSPDTIVQVTDDEL